MNNNVLLISENLIKDNSIVSDNVDGKYIQAAIVNAQEIHLQPTIGTKLFRKLQDDIVNNSLNEAYEDLIKYYIHPVLINAVCSDLVLYTTYKIRNMGVINTTDSNITVPSLKDLQYIRQDYLDKVNFYKNRLTDYLTKNYQTYPEYISCLACEDGLPANRKAYKTNIVL